MVEQTETPAITNKDWQQVENHIKQELAKRQNDNFRKQAERKWKEVDRQTAMISPEVYGQKKGDWHSSIELGELAKASEIITADVMRILFPNTRQWFDCHIDLPPVLDPQTGQNVTPSNDEQVKMDGTLRALMAQQHIDFGFKSRLSMSVREALHHGSFVAEARGEDAVLYSQDGGMANVHAPVWVPHSMWNCYPDPSPSVLGANMFYTGSMIIREYMPLYQLRKIAEAGVEKGWMPSNLKRVKKTSNKNKDNETDDVELIKYYGDCVIDRKGQPEVYLPNSKVILANNVIVYYAPNELPYPSILFNGYERLDVRDPYYTSPLIKLSPLHKLATTLANKLVDIISLHGEPPILYDANDPQFAQDGGPVLEPGRKTGTKYFGKGMQELKVGDPTPTLNGLTLALDQLRSGTSVDSIRAGSSDTDRVTAQEIRTTQARSEVRVVDFVDKLEYSIKTFLYMQHELNKRELGVYSFYNPEMDSPDFMRATREDLPENVHFDVVGAKGVLGQEERSQKMTAVTAFASGNPLFAPLLKPADLLKEMYMDAGTKNPERFLNIPGDEMEQIAQQIEQKYQQVIEEGKERIFELEKELAIKSAVNDAKVVEAEIKANKQGEISQFKAEVTGQLEAVKTGMKVAEHQAKQQPQQDIGQVVSMVKEIVKNDDAEHKKEIEMMKGEMANITSGVKALATAVEKSTEKQTEVEVEYDEEGRISSVNGKKIKRKKGK